ncbi:hypothetical protein ROT00_07515 [Agromyces mediolanus]|uniref:hypothetical protein n=1 Tax=Agromyces mediolanus TaxID=41986 RepID=UPI003834DB9F
MGAPRFIPRDFTSSPHLFGRAEVEWPPVEGRERVMERECARLQHAFSLAVRDGLREKQTSLRRYARDLGLDYGRLGRIMRGEIPMKLEDVMLASRHFPFRLQLQRHQPNP